LSLCPGSKQWPAQYDCGRENNQSAELLLAQKLALDESLFQCGSLVQMGRKVSRAIMASKQYSGKITA